MLIEVIAKTVYLNNHQLTLHEPPQQLPLPHVSAELVDDEE